jgi:predicted dehydrogenase
MTTLLRAGVVGTGFMGQVHARAVRASGNVVAALVGSSEQRAVAAAQTVGSERVEADLSSLLAAGDIDVVHICTPNALHVAQAKLVIEHGLPVICEKPLAVDQASAAELTRLAEDRGVVATVPFVYRFYPVVREARARVGTDGGELRLIHGSYLQDWLAGDQAWNWRVELAQGGPSRAFGDIGVHWCDLAEFVTGHRIVRLAARTLTTERTDPSGARVRPETEDAVVLQFETDRGALGSAVISQLSHGRKNRLWLTVDGARASYAFDQELPDTLWVGSVEQNSIVHRGSASTSAAAQRYDIVPAGHPQGYQDCFTAFVGDTYRAIRGEQVDGLPTFADGARAAVLTAAMLESARTGTWIDVASDVLATS